MSRLALLALRDECFCTKLGPLEVLLYGYVEKENCGYHSMAVFILLLPTPSTFDDAVLLSVADASPLLVAIMTGAQSALLKHCHGYLRTKKYQKSGLFLRGV